MTFKKEYLSESLLKVLTPEPQTTKALMKLTGWKRTTLMNTLQALYNEGVIERQVISGMPGNTGYVYLWLKKDNSETWKIRGMGMDKVPCFLTGLPPESDGFSYRNNISGFVDSKEAGERIVEMFGGNDYAWLDYREDEPNWIQVKIGIDRRFGDKGIEVLRRVDYLVKLSGDKISKDIIEQVRVEFSELKIEQ